MRGDLPSRQWHISRRAGPGGLKATLYKNTWVSKIHASGRDFRLKRPQELDPGAPCSRPPFKFDEGVRPGPGLCAYVAPAILGSKFHFISFHFMLETSRAQDDHDCRNLRSGVCFNCRSLKWWPSLVAYIRTIGSLELQPGFGGRQKSKWPGPAGAGGGFPANFKFGRFP